MNRPPLPIRVIGRSLSSLAIRAPFLWPVLRGPTRRFWQRSAGAWDKRIDPDSPEHLAPLNTACERIGAEPAKVLELGTGTGAGALMLARRFPQAEIRAADLSPAMVDAARAKAGEELSGRVRFEVADAAALPYPDSEFDLVTQLNLPLYIDELVRVLRPGGHVLIASSLGRSTPYHTPEPLLKKLFERRGFEDAAMGRAGDGTWFTARKPGGPPPRQ